MWNFEWNAWNFMWNFTWSWSMWASILRAKFHLKFMWNFMWNFEWNFRAFVVTCLALTIWVLLHLPFCSNSMRSRFREGNNFFTSQHTCCPYISHPPWYLTYFTIKILPVYNRIQIDFQSMSGDCDILSTSIQDHPPLTVNPLLQINNSCHKRKASTIKLCTKNKCKTSFCWLVSEYPMEKHVDHWQRWWF